MIVVNYVHAQENQFGQYREDNIIAVGYQIGGYTLIGLDYEVRMSDYIGIHAGAGYLGYTLGVKIHIRTTRNSSFFNLSYKDGGIGLVGVFALEYGGKLMIIDRKNNFGLHCQAGLAKVLTMDERFKDYMFHGEDAPSLVISIGFGFSW